MKQIINRIGRFIKSEVKSSKFEANSNFDHEHDNDLKKIIDELENEKNNFKTNQKQSNFDHKTQKITLNQAIIILGVNNNATKEEIKASYKKKVMEYHPDRVDSLGAELKDLAKKKTLEINQAYDLLKKNGRA